MGTDPQIQGKGMVKNVFTSRAAAESNSGVGGRCSSADVCLIGFIGVKVSPVGVVLQQTFVS